MAGVARNYADEQARGELFDRFYQESVDRGMEEPGYRGDRDALDLHAHASAESAAQLRSLEKLHPGASWTEIAERVDGQRIEQGFEISF